MSIFSKKATFIALTFFTMSATVLFVSCEEETAADYTSEVQYYKNAQLTNIYENEVTVLNAVFIDETKELESLINNFSQEKTEASLILAQNQWLKTLKVWKQIELYNVGEIADSFIHSEIGFWPANQEFIEKFIKEGELVNQEFVASKGVSSKGINGLEYLLFNENNVQVLSSYTTDENWQNRTLYLNGVAERLYLKSLELQSLWASYAASFTGNLENGVDGSQNQVINQMVSIVEEILISKLGKPLGDVDSGNVAIDKLEAGRSETSLEIINQHLLSLKRCYNGDFAATPFRVGFDDFLILIGSEDFSAKITNQIAVCQEKIDTIEHPLKEELLSNPDAVVDLKDSFTDLLVLIKVDMANVLGSTITFNDNDGD